MPIPLAHPQRHEAAYQEAMKVAQLLAQTGARLIWLDEMSEARMAVSGRVDESRDGMSDRSGTVGGDSRAIAESCRELAVSRLPSPCRHVR